MATPPTEWEMSEAQEAEALMSATAWRDRPITRPSATDNPVVAKIGEPSQLERKLSIRTLNLLLLAALSLSIVIATAVGAVRVPLSEVLATFLHPSRASEAHQIIF